MKKIMIKLLGWMLSPQFIEQLFNKYVPKTYRIVNQHEINVKKGKRRYTLYVVETKNPHKKITFNLGRH